MIEDFELNVLHNGAGETTTTNSSNSKAEHFIQQLNANNFKKLALSIVIGFIVYHGILNWQYGKQSRRIFQ